LTGKSGRKTANVCDASTKEMNINTAANFMLVAFIKINRLSSFFSEICRPKFPKLFRSWKNPDSGPALDRQWKTRGGAAYREKALIFWPGQSPD